MTLNPSKIRLLQLTDLDDINGICQLYPELHWSLIKIRETLANPRTLGFGLFKAQTLISFAMVANILDEAELLLIATHKDFCQHGYALQLLKATIQELKARQIKKFYLEVRASNTSAIKLYQRCGFTQFNVRKSYYQHPTEDALIMELALADN